MTAEPADQPRTLKDVPLAEMPEHIRKQAAIDLLEQAKKEGRPEPVAKELMAQTGVTYSQAYDIKRKVRGGPSFTFKKPPAQRAARFRVPAAESWALIQDFIDAHPGETYSRIELSRATGVPPDTITRLWHEKLGLSYSEWKERPDPVTDAPQAHAGEYKDGTTFTVCGRLGSDILAEHGGEIVRLVIRPLTGGS